MSFRILGRATAVGMSLLMFSAGIALADTVIVTNDVALNTNVTKAAGSNGTGYVRLEVTNGTPVGDANGCNATGADPLSVTLSSNNAGVTLSGNPVSIPGCGVDVSFGYTIASAASGSATISVTSYSGGKTDGPRLYQTSDTLVITITSSNTPPTVVVTGVSDGASYGKASVPAAGCDVTDAEDGNSSFAATLSTITGPYASDGIGSQTASCSYTDGGGLSDSDSATYDIVDPSPPSISYVLNPDPADGLLGWWVSNVTLTWTVTDTESPNSLSKTGCVDQNITADQTVTLYSCSATSAGGSAGPEQVSIGRDATDPDVTPGSVVNTVWRNTDLSQTFASSDATSLLAVLGDASFTLTASLESADASTPTVVSHTVYDNAGNSTTRSVSALIDKTDPDVTCNAASFALNQSPANVTASVSDGLSGAAPASVSAAADTSSVGSHSVTLTGYDVAGNSKTVSCSYSVSYVFTGFFAPIDNPVTGKMNGTKAGSAVPFKWRLTDANGNPVLSLANVQLTVTGLTCSLGTSVDQLEELATGSSGLQNLGDGYYQFNWKTPTSYAKSCKTAHLNLFEGTATPVYHDATFSFSK